ncbi:MAG TPA: S8 family peptidase [Rhizomicrobium sp.]|nr:S8 family peptidase [Rhizomicrobium sp.]
MRVRGLLAVMATVAALCCGSSANAMSGGALGRVSLDVQNFFTPSLQADGTVYGVRARSIRSQLPTLQILPAGIASNSTTPGPCGGAGWCNTSHNIAATAFDWTFGFKGAGAIIGIVDTGVDLNHPEFTGRILPGTCLAWSGNPCTDPTNSVGGDNGLFSSPDVTHGTHVAGIAAGKNVGLASQAKILPVKVCATQQNSCNRVTEGIVWASAHGASVINVSIGGPILDAGSIADMQTAIANGALIVVAAGNSDNKYPTGGFLAGAALMDGIRGSLIPVGATGAGNKIASFSQTPGNRCEIHDGHNYCMRDYFVVAPGLDIWSSVGNGADNRGPDTYGYLSGTSMATPYVTGVAAIIKGRWPTLTSSQIADIIFNTADDIGAPGDDAIYGRGAVDITRALTPLNSAVVATSGTLATATTANSIAKPTNVTGAPGAQTSYVSGALSRAVANSTLLKHVVVVDSYGRDFTADLTRATYNPGFDFAGLLSNDFVTSYSPFAVSMASPVGNFTASGYAVDTITPRLLSGMLRDNDRHQFDVRDLAITASLTDDLDLDLGYKTDMAGRFNSYDAQGSAAYDGLFYSASAVNSPYAGFTNGGNFVGATVALADDLHFRFGESSLDPQRADFEVPVYSMVAQLQGPLPLYDQRQAKASLAGVTWDFAPWGGLGLTASQTAERNGLLGGVNSGSLAMTDAADTSALGLSARIGFGEGWVTTVSYSEGITKLNLKSGSLLSGADPLRSRAYGVAVAKHGLFDDGDTLGLALTRPVQIFAGGVDLTAADGVDADGNLTIGNEHVSLASPTPETDLELGYVTTFLDGALALQANAGYQMNVQGKSGAQAVSVLSRAKINF